MQDWADYLDKLKADAEVIPDYLSTSNVLVNGLNGKEASTQVIPPPVNNPDELTPQPERPSMAQSLAGSQDKVKEFRMNSEKDSAKATLPPVNNPDKLTPQPERISMAQSFADSFDKTRGKDILRIVGVK